MADRLRTRSEHQHWLRPKPHLSNLINPLTIIFTGVIGPVVPASPWRHSLRHVQIPHLCSDARAQDILFTDWRNIVFFQTVVPLFTDSCIHHTEHAGFMPFTRKQFQKMQAMQSLRAGQNRLLIQLNKLFERGTILPLQVVYLDKTVPGAAWFWCDTSWYNTFAAFAATGSLLVRLTWCDVNP